MGRGVGLRTSEKGRCVCVLLKLNGLRGSCVFGDRLRARVKTNQTRDAGRVRISPSPPQRISLWAWRRSWYRFVKARLRVLPLMGQPDV